MMFLGIPAIEDLESIFFAHGIPCPFYF